MTSAPNYNDGKWHGWNGGECPVHPLTKVQVIFDDGSGARDRLADEFNWGNPIAQPVAFRVVKEHREPREWFVFVKSGFVVDYTVGRDDPDVEVVKVREVLE